MTARSRQTSRPRDDDDDDRVLVCVPVLDDDFDDDFDEDFPRVAAAAAVVAKGRRRLDRR